MEHRENRFSELVYAIRGRRGGYTRNISLFIDTALKKLNESNDKEQNKILATIHAYIISNSQMAQELKFLTCWAALEKLANAYYNIYKSKNRLFSKSELKRLKLDLEKALEKSLGDDKRLSLVRKSITRNFLYEHNTLEKIMLYSCHLDLEFDESKLRKMVKKLIGVRGGLVHDLQSSSLSKSPNLLFYLQMIMENVLFRVLGVDKNMQKQFLLNQYNRGTEL